jgi:hypothetical protein
MRQSLCNNLSKAKTITEAKAFNFTGGHIDYALSINNPNLAN